ncbi:hypothetical protein BCY90_26225 [Agrobacterium deltaense]|nr:hypothetical protein BCY90_26225 [Agrobacterium deltaense]
MLDVARQSVDGDTEHDIDPLALYMRQKLLDAGTRCEGGSADRGVGIGLDQLPASVGDKRLAEFDLGFDRYFVLAVGGVAGIKQHSLGHRVSRIEMNLGTW